MEEIWSSGIEFVSDHAWWFLGISFASLGLAVVLMPALVSRVPADYFSHARRLPVAATSGRPVLKLAIAGLKNLLGAILVLAGLLMLFVPGQGLLTILVGLIIMNYPGKFALERWLIGRPQILSAVNWLRARHGRPPLDPPGCTE